MTSSSMAAAVSSSTSSWRPGRRRGINYILKRCPRGPPRRVMKTTRASLFTSHSGGRRGDSDSAPIHPHPSRSGGGRIGRANALLLLLHSHLAPARCCSTSRRSGSALVTAIAPPGLGGADSASSLITHQVHEEEEEDVAREAFHCDVDFKLDPGLNHALLSEADCLSVARRFTRDAEWVAYQSPRRYWETMLTFTGSVVARRVALPSLVVACWTVAVAELARGSSLFPAGIAAGEGGGHNNAHFTHSTHPRTHSLTQSPRICPPPLPPLSLATGRTRTRKNTPTVTTRHILYFSPFCFLVFFLFNACACVSRKYHISWYAYM